MVFKYFIKKKKNLWKNVCQRKSLAQLSRGNMAKVCELSKSVCGRRRDHRPQPGYEWPR